MMTKRRTRVPAQRIADCRRQLGELFAFLDGELSADRCKAIERHLADCPCCARLQAGLRRAIDICRASGDVSLPAAVRTRAHARIERLLRSWNDGTRVAPRTVRRPHVSQR